MGSHTILNATFQLLSHQEDTISKRKIVDTFLANDETALLDFRLRYLNSKVDLHVLGESRFTFQGTEKPLHFSNRRDYWERRFPRLRIVEIPGFVGDGNLSNAAKREILQRDWFSSYCSRSVPDESIVLSSDIDEIPSPTQLDYLSKNMEKGEILSLPMIFAYRFANWAKDNRPENWSFVKAWIGEYPQSNLRFSRFPSCPGEPGLHLSYVGFDESLLASKLSSFSHTEYAQAHMMTRHVLRFANDFAIDHLPRIGESFGLLKHIPDEGQITTMRAAISFNANWAGKTIDYSPARRIIAATILNEYRKSADSQLLQTAYKPSRSPAVALWAYLLALGHFSTQALGRLRKRIWHP